MKPQIDYENFKYKEKKKNYNKTAYIIKILG